MGHLLGKEYDPTGVKHLTRVPGTRVAPISEHGKTLQATALIHAAHLRPVDVDQAQHWNSRGYFFAATAKAAFP
jgi:hypothetical protein